MIHVGVDLHQRFCYVTAMKATGEVIVHESVANQAESLQRLLRSVPEPAQVVVEACGFWPAFERCIRSEAARAVMAHLSRCDLLPEAWMADPATQQMRLQVRLRIALGRQRARSKNPLQGVLHQEGMRRPVSDVLGRQGRQWLRPA